MGNAWVATTTITLEKSGGVPQKVSVGHFPTSTKAVWTRFVPAKAIPSVVAI